MRIVVTLLLLTLLPAATVQAGNVQIGVSFVVGEGESVVVGDLPLVVQFDEVLADSRCPTSVLCFWEGEAGTQLTLSRPGMNQSVVELHTAGSPFGPSEVEFEGHRVVLLKLDPYPEFPAPPESRDYQVELVVHLVQQGLSVEPSTWSTLKSTFR